MLLIGDHVVLRATVPPEAEFALFDAGDIELRTSEPGRVREHGYQTTVGEARRRLGQLGISRRAVDAVLAAMVPDLVRSYARGEPVRRVLGHLGGRELLACDAFSGDPPSYRGVYLDLSQLALHTGLPGAAVTLRLLSLALTLESEHEDARVTLATDLYTKDRRTGERTFRRPSHASVAELEAALGRLAARRPAPVSCEPLPRADVVAFLRERAHAADDEDEATLYARLERSVCLRERPERGPLAEPDIWEIELRIETDRHEGLVPAIDALERKYGKTPATSYLRGRAALALRSEHPRAVAERISALALSMTSFQELSLLAAEAWLDAGDPRRAVPFARDVVDAPGVDEGLLLAAQRTLARAVGAAPEMASRSPAAARGASVAPPAGARASVPPADRPAAATARPPHGSIRPPVVLDVPPPPKTPNLVTPVTSFTLDLPGHLTPPPAPAASNPPPNPGSMRPNPGSMRPREPSLLPPTFDDSSTPRVPSVAPAPGRLTPPPAPAASRSQPPPRTSSLPPRPERSLSPPSGRTSSGFSRAVGGARVETVAPARTDPRAEPSDVLSLGSLPSHRPPRVDVHDPSLAPRSARPQKVDESVRNSQPPRATSTSEAPRVPLVTPASARAGAARPAWQVESPAPRLARAPLLPPSQSDEEIAAEALTLPGAAEDASSGGVPRSVLEARATFTKLARTLGREYRARRGVTLTTGVRGVEAMQAVLLDLFPDHEVHTDEQADLVAAHGALFSEILARTLGAEWFDLEGSDVMSWSMIVPPDARVWPFARIARLVAMGHRERDLVATFLEVSTRASRGGR